MVLYTVGLKSDGTVVAVGDNYKGQCDVGGWTEIMQVAASSGGIVLGRGYTVGLRFDGTVVAVGDNYNGQCDVGGWTDITQVAAGSYHTVGVKSDGTVVAVGDNYNGQCDVGSWMSVVQVAAGAYHAVGIKSDGTVLAVGHSNYGQCNVEGWLNIIQIAAGGLHTVGRKSDGTVVAVGYNDFGQCDVSSWTDIVQVATGSSHTVGLEADGTVVAVGYNNFGQCDVGGWDLVAGVNWPLFGGIIAAAVAAGLVFFFVRRRRHLQPERRKSLGEPESMSVRVSFVSKIWGFLRNPATTFRRQLAKDFLWLLLYPAYQTIGTIRHEGSHALAAMAEGVGIKEFVFWPARGYWGYVAWDASPTWFAWAAPYFCDLITFFVAFLIVLVAKPKPRWLWFNILIIGMLSPFINSLHNYWIGVAGSGDVSRLLGSLEPLAVHLFFVITLLLYLWGMYYCYFRKRYQV